MSSRKYELGSLSTEALEADRPGMADTGPVAQAENGDGTANGHGGRRRDSADDGRPMVIVGRTFSDDDLFNDTQRLLDASARAHAHLGATTGPLARPVPGHSDEENHYSDQSPLHDRSPNRRCQGRLHGGSPEAQGGSGDSGVFVAAPQLSQPPAVIDPQSPFDAEIPVVDEDGSDDNDSRGRRGVEGGAEGGVIDGTDSEIRAAAMKQHEDLRAIFEAITAKELNPRQRLYYILYGTPALSSDLFISRLYNVVHIAIVVLSVLSFMIFTLPYFYQPNIRLAGPAYYIEVFTVAFFSLDFLVRIFASTTWRGLLNITLLIDFLSFLGFYVELIIFFTLSEPTSAIGLTLLRTLRLLRVARLFKLARTNRGFSMLIDVVLKSKDGLFLLMMLLVIAVLVCSSILFFIEQVSNTFDPVRGVWLQADGTESPFQSIPHTFWFVCTTITTVGYGDHFPYSIYGRMWTIMIMLFGVLVLSFPNILIGSNFSDVHKAVSRDQARHQLGIYFRRVRMVVRFIRMWRDFRVKGRIGLISGPMVSGDRRASLARKRVINFIMRVSDFPDRYLAESAERAALGNIDQIQHKGLTLLTLMQRLLETFSSCATIDELTHFFALFPVQSSSKDGPVTATHSSVFEVVLRGAAAQFMHFFVLNRENETGVVILNKRGIEVLQNFPENGTLPCLRCYSEARDIWFQTVKQSAYDFLPMDGYRNWQTVQTKLRKRVVVDFCYDMKSIEAKKNDIFAGLNIRYSKANTDSSARRSKCSCRFCDLKWGLAAPVRPVHDYCFVPDDEFLELELQYAAQRLELFRLERKVSTLANVTQDTILDS